MAPRQHELIEAALARWFATSYLCGGPCLFVGWWAECVFAEVKSSLQDWEPAPMARWDVRQDQSPTFLLLA